MTRPLVALKGEMAGPSGTVSAEVAAALLGTTPATLRLWADRFGYPLPIGGGRTRYSYAAVIALRDALSREFSIAAAVAVVCGDSASA
jgi:hypothetical protein